MPSYFNIFECGRNILNKLDVTYEKACMANTRDKYFEKMLETLVDYSDNHNAPLYNKKFKQAISTVMAETEEEEHSTILDANNVTMDTFCQYPVTTNTQGDNVKIIFISERENTSEMLA